MVESKVNCKTNKDERLDLEEFCFVLFCFSINERKEGGSWLMEEWNGLMEEWLMEWNGRKSSV